MHNESTHVNTNLEVDHYFKSRNFDLAEQVSRLPDSALVGAFEIAALSGIAATSIMKPVQRKSIGMPEPRVIGRMNKWSLGTIRAWLQQGVDAKQIQLPQQRGRGRPTLASKLGKQI